MGVCVLHGDPPSLHGAGPHLDYRVLEGGTLFGSDWLGQCLSHLDWWISEVFTLPRYCVRFMHFLRIPKNDLGESRLTRDKVERNWNEPDL